MKKILLFTTLLFSCILLMQCSKTPTSVVTDDTPSGAVVFYTRSNLGAGKIDVYIDSTKMGQITKYYPDAPITCDAGLSLTVEQAPGTHKLRAVSETGIEWTKDIEFLEGQCTNYELTEHNIDTTGIICLTTMYGTWILQNETYTGKGTNGMIVKCENGVGTITYVQDNNTNKYKAGDVLWKDYYSDDCMLNFLSSKSLNLYSYRTVKFYSNNHMRISGGGDFYRKTE
ncbi:MAG: hypothetical protein KDC07_05775 [Chitinophagaceae bacterium]|nr:hypothetical protein [Chitinophagaceae bacterium]MCB9047092.1 hypothetical protein [Chitinophagales bacterium]